MLRDVGIYDHAPSTTPHPPRHIHHATSTTPRRPHATHHVDVRNASRFRPRPVNAATSTPATSTIPHQRPPRIPMMTGHKKRRSRRRWDEEVGRGGESTQRRGQDDASHVDPQCRPPAATLADPCRREPHRWCHVHVSHVDASRIDGCHVDVSCIDGCHVDASHIDTQRRRHEPRRRADGVNATLTIPRGLCELPPFL